VINKNIAILGDKLIGSVEVPLSTFLPSMKTKASKGGSSGDENVMVAPITKTLKLMDKSGKNVAGELQVCGLFRLSEFEGLEAEQIDNAVNILRAAGKKDPEASASAVEKIKSIQTVAATRSAAGRLDIVIERAQNLSKASKTSDPYLKLSLLSGSDVEQKGKVLRDGGTNPEFDQSFSFLTDDGEAESLQISILDENQLLSDSLLGSARLPLKDFALKPGETIRRSIPLEILSSKKGSVVGDVVFAATFFGDEGVGVYSKILQRNDRDGTVFARALACDFPEYDTTEGNVRMRVKCDDVVYAASTDDADASVVSQKKKQGSKDAFPSYTTPVVASSKTLHFNHTFEMALPPTSLWRSNQLGLVPCVTISLESEEHGRVLGQATVPLTPLLLYPDRVFRRTFQLFRPGSDGVTKADICGTAQFALQFHASSSTSTPAVAEAKATTTATANPIAPFVPFAENAREVTEVPGRFILHVFRATDLPSVSMMSTQDPYVQIKMLPSQQRATTSEVDNGGTKPEWDELLFMDCADATMSQLCLSVLDKNNGRDQLIGEVWLAAGVFSYSRSRAERAKKRDTLNNKAAQAGKDVEDWFNLFVVEKTKTKESSAAASKGAGRVRVAVRFVPESVSLSKSQTPSAPISYIPGPGKLFVKILKGRKLQGLQAGEHPFLRLAIPSFNWKEDSPDSLNTPSKEELKRGADEDAYLIVWDCCLEAPLHWRQQEQVPPTMSLQVRCHLRSDSRVIADGAVQLSPFVLFPGQPAQAWFPLQHGGHPAGEVLVALQYLPRSRPPAIVGKEGGGGNRDTGTSSEDVMEPFDPAIMKVISSEAKPWDLHVRIDRGLSLPGQSPNKPLAHPQVQASLRFPSVSSFTKGKLDSTASCITNPVPLAAASGGGSNPIWGQDVILDYAVSSDKIVEVNTKREGTTPFLLLDVVDGSTKNEKGDTVPMVVGKSVEIPLFPFLVHDGHLMDAWFPLAKGGGGKIHVVVQSIPHGGDASALVKTTEDKTDKVYISVDNVVGVPETPKPCMLYVKVKLDGQNDAMSVQTAVSTSVQFAGASKNTVVSAAWNSVLKLPFLGPESSVSTPMLVVQLWSKNMSGKSDHLLGQCMQPLGVHVIKENQEELMTLNLQDKSGEKARGQLFVKVKKGPFGTAVSHAPAHDHGSVVTAGAVYAEVVSFNLASVNVSRFKITLEGSLASKVHDGSTMPGTTQRLPKSMAIGQKCVFPVLGITEKHGQPQKPDVDNLAFCANVQAVPASGKVVDVGKCTVSSAQLKVVFDHPGSQIQSVYKVLSSNGVDDGVSQLGHDDMTIAFRYIPHTLGTVKLTISAVRGMAKTSQKNPVHAVVQLLPSGVAVKIADAELSEDRTSATWGLKPSSTSANRNALSIKYDNAKEQEVPFVQIILYRSQGAAIGVCKVPVLAAILSCDETLSEWFELQEFDASGENPGVKTGELHVSWQFEGSIGNGAKLMTEPAEQIRKRVTQMEKMKRLFYELDTDRSGSVSQAELLASLSVNAEAAALLKAAAPNKTPEAIFAAMDSNSDGSVSFEEFAALVGQANIAAAKNATKALEVTATEVEKSATSTPSVTKDDNGDGIDALQKKLIIACRQGDTRKVQGLLEQHEVDVTNVDEATGTPLLHFVLLDFTFPLSLFVLFFFFRRGFPTATRCSS
jgi:hypothetical protein